MDCTSGTMGSHTARLPVGLTWLDETVVVASDFQWAVDFRMPCFLARGLRCVTRSSLQGLVDRGSRDFGIRARLHLELVLGC